MPTANLASANWSVFNLRQAAVILPAVWKFKTRHLVAQYTAIVIHNEAYGNVISAIGNF